MKKNSRPRIRAIINCIAFVAVLIINYLAVTLPIGGNSTGALADMYPNLFVPAGYTFSIRSIIYTYMLIFIIRQCIDAFRKKTTDVAKNIGPRFLLSCMANIGRIFARHYTYVGISVLVMLCFLAVLIVTTHKINTGTATNSTTKFLVQTPFSIYLGRISVATIANIATRLVATGRNGWGMSDVSWTILVIIVATVLALIALYKKANIIFALVVIRAFVGIINKRLDTDPVYTTNIIWTLGICIAVIAAGIGRKFETRKKL